MSYKFKYSSVNVLKQLPRSFTSLVISSFPLFSSSPQINTLLLPPFLLLPPLMCPAFPSISHPPCSISWAYVKRKQASAPWEGFLCTLPFRARSPSVARRQYGHALPGEEVGHGPRREALLDFIWVSVSWCEFRGRFCAPQRSVWEEAAWRSVKDKKWKLSEDEKGGRTKDTSVCW